MWARVNEFFRNESGNAVIDWVVLTAGIVMLGLAAGLAVGQPTKGLAENIDTTLESMSPGG